MMLESRTPRVFMQKEGYENCPLKKRPMLAIYVEQDCVVPDEPENLSLEHSTDEDRLVICEEEDLEEDYKSVRSPSPTPVLDHRSGPLEPIDLNTQHYQPYAPQASWQNSVHLNYPLYPVARHSPDMYSSPVYPVQLPYSPQLSPYAPRDSSPYAPRDASPPHISPPRHELSMTLPSEAKSSYMYPMDSTEHYMSQLSPSECSLSPNECRLSPSDKSAPRYQCTDCNKSYSTFSGLSKHKQFHCLSQSKKSFSCKYCDKVYVSLGALKMHIRTHTLPCKCKLCGKAFSRPWLLQGHIRTHTGEKPFSCQDCGRSFADRSNLRAHLQTHSDVKKYSCKSCSKTFSRMSLLLKHEDSGCPGILGHSNYAPLTIQD